MIGNGDREMQTTYTETVFRYRVVKRDRRCLNDPEYRAILSINGIDPDDNWQLVWSFMDRESAEAQLEEDLEIWGDFYDMKVVDAGETTTIERPVW